MSKPIVQQTFHKSWNDNQHTRQLILDNHFHDLMYHEIATAMTDLQRKIKSLNKQRTIRKTMKISLTSC